MGDEVSGGVMRGGEWKGEREWLVLSGVRC